MVSNIGKLLMGPGWGGRRGPVRWSAAEPPSRGRQAGGQPATEGGAKPGAKRRLAATVAARPGRGRLRTQAGRRTGNRRAGYRAWGGWRGWAWPAFIPERMVAVAS